MKPDGTNGNRRLIPPFNDSGFLPSGIHPATISEIEARFGSEPEIRRVQIESVRWMVELAVRAGIERIILNGSFVTDIIEPNDVDCVLLLPQRGPVDEDAFNELKAGLPFLDIALAKPKRFRRYVTQIFAADRDSVPKGMVEVLLNASE